MWPWPMTLIFNMVLEVVEVTCFSVCMSVWIHSLCLDFMNLVRLRAIWITNHPSSVLWHCWLGHLTCKNIVSEMTVSSGTLNLAQPTNQCMSICVSVCLYVCMYVCMYVCLWSAVKESWPWEGTSGEVVSWSRSGWQQEVTGRCYYDY